MLSVSRAPGHGTPEERPAGTRSVASARNDGAHAVTRSSPSMGTASRTRYLQAMSLHGARVEAVLVVLDLEAEHGDHVDVRNEFVVVVRGPSGSQCR
jgi:hypothetical protein